MSRTAPIVALLALALALLWLTGCGSSDETTGGATSEENPPASSSGAPVGVRAKSCGVASKQVVALRVTGVGCAEGRRLASSWAAAESCTVPKGASRASCRVEGKVCLTAVADRGLAVTCAARGRSVAFIARRG